MTTHTEIAQPLTRLENNVIDVPYHLRLIFNVSYNLITKQYNIDSMLKLFIKYHPKQSCLIFLNEVKDILKFPDNIFDYWIIKYAAYIDEEKIKALTITSDILAKLEIAYKSIHKKWFFQYHYNFNLGYICKGNVNGENPIRATMCYTTIDIPRIFKKNRLYRHNWAIDFVCGNGLTNWRIDPHQEKFQEFAKLMNYASNIINQEILFSYYKNKIFIIPLAAPPIERTAKKCDNYLRDIFADCINGFEKDLDDLKPEDRIFVEQIDSYLKYENHSLETLRCYETFISKFIEVHIKDPSIYLIDFKKQVSKDPNFVSIDIDIEHIMIYLKIRGVNLEEPLKPLDSLYGWITQFHSNRRKTGIHLHDDCYLSRKDFVLFVKNLTTLMEEAESTGALNKLRETIETVTRWKDPLILGNINKMYSTHIDKSRIGDIGFYCPCYNCTKSEHNLLKPSPPDENEKKKEIREKFQRGYLTNPLVYHAKIICEPCDAFINLCAIGKANYHEFKQLLTTNLPNDINLVEQCFAAIDKRMKPPEPKCMKPVLCPLCTHPNIAKDAIQNCKSSLDPNKNHPSHIICGNCDHHFCLDCGDDHFTISNPYICRGSTELLGTEEQTCISCNVKTWKDPDTCPLVHCKRCLKIWCWTCRCYRKEHGSKHSCMVKLIYQKNKFPGINADSEFWLKRPDDSLEYRLYLDEERWCKDDVVIYDKIVELNDDFMIKARA